MGPEAWPRCWDLLPGVLLLFVFGPGPSYAAENGGGLREEVVAEAPSLVLRDLIVEVRKVNPEIRAGRRRVEAARARVPQARALPDPTLSLGYANESFRRFTLGMSDDTSIGISASQEIPFPAKLSLKGEIADTEAAREREALRATELDVISRLKLAYYDLFFVRAAITVINRNKDLMGRLVRNAETQYAVGQAAEQDVLRGQTEIAILLQRLAQLQQQRGSVQAAINALLTRPWDAPLGKPVEPPGAKLSYTLEQLVDLALKGSPELKAADRSIARNELALDLARKQYYPDFTIGLGYNNRSAIEPIWQVTVGVTVPLYFRSKQDYGVKEAAADLGAAREGHEAVRQSLLFKLKDLFLTAQTSARLMELIGTGTLPQALRALESSRSSYEQGKVDFLTVISNLLNVLNQQLQYCQEQTNFQKALVRLEQAVGAPPE